MYQESQYKGDAEYSIRCTGDAVCGDEVRFERAVFTGSFRAAKFSHFELITGTITKDSYGAAKQQHTFTLQLSDGNTTRIKGRNLYANGTYRKPWINESKRVAARDEKHERGNQARATRTRRYESQLRGI